MKLDSPQFLRLIPESHGVQADVNDPPSFPDNTKEESPMAEQNIEVSI